MCKAENRPYLYGVNGDNELVWFRPDCGLWGCPECAIRNKNRWVLRVQHGIEFYKMRGEKFWFMTLTSHEKLSDFENTVQVWPKAWAKLYARMKRVQPDLHYASVPEKHPSSGRLHMHYLINEGFGSESKENQGRWIKDIPRECGFGFMNEIEPLNDSYLAAYYVTKYISKNLEVYGWPRNLRRIRVSAHWPELPPDSEFEPLEVNYSVMLDKREFRAVLGRFEASGYKIRALKPEDKEDLLSDVQ